MMEIDRLIEYYRTLGLKDLNFGHRMTLDVLESTITYLVAFKQVHEMLRRLAEAIEGVNPEGD